MVTTFTHRLLPPRIIYSTLFVCPGHLRVWWGGCPKGFHVVEAWERRTRGEQAVFWPLLGKTAKSRSNSSHSPQSCVHAIYAVHTDKHKCLPQMHRRAPSLINEDLRWGSLCVKEDLWRRVAEFCNLSTYARRSIVDPRGKREEMEEMLQQIPKYFDWRADKKQCIRNIWNQTGIWFRM